MPAPTRSLSILVVEDCRDGAEMLSLLLRLYGHAPTIAYDGVEGLAAAERDSPDVIISDIGLPRMDGLELARRLRDQSSRPLLVALSGFGMREERDAALRAGYDLHILKPVDPERLRDLLAEYAARLTKCPTAVP
jgi:two-component system, sensor histidine kinase